MIGVVVVVAAEAAAVVVVVVVEVVVAASGAEGCQFVTFVGQLLAKLARRNRTPFSTENLHHPSSSPCSCFGLFGGEKNCENTLLRSN